jgi:mycofactocin system glycosyltransferase
VAFVDSDCVVPAGFPGRLLDHLGDPALAVAAPRITALDPDAPGVLSRYETHHSSLDMGGRAGLVAPGTAVPYAPSATLVARASALGAGFDEDLTMGEDVDLLWRLHDQGWQVRYDPAVVVAHDHRTRLRPWLARRMAYNSSNATLLARHPGRVPALSLSRGGALFWGLVAAGSPIAAGATSAVSAGLLHRALRERVPGSARVAVALVLRSRLHEGRHLARALAGPWLPLSMALTVLRPRLGRRLWLGIGASLIAEWSVERHEPTPVHYALPRLADDLARCAGIWRGCWRERRVGSLLPRIHRR